MRRALLILLVGWPVYAAGTCTVGKPVSAGSTPGGGAPTWSVTLSCTGDASTGSFPATLLAPALGYFPQLTGAAISQVQITPLSPAPTAGYAFALVNSNSVDELGGAANNLSATLAANFNTTAGTPINGSESLQFTGNSVASAKTQAVLYIAVPSSGGSGACATATTAVSGCVRPDGSTITISGGVISSVGGSGSVTSTSCSASGANWLTCAVGTPTTTPAVSIAAATGQTSHRVIGTCGSGTSFGPCALVPGDLPTATSAALGIAQPDNASILINGSGVLSLPIQPSYIISPALRIGLLAGAAGLKNAIASSNTLQIWLGDSWVAGETFTSRIRTIYQQRLGNNGQGYCPLDITNSPPAGITLATTGTWSDTTNVNSPQFGATSSVDFATPAQKEIGFTGDQAVMYYLGGGGLFKWRVDAAGFATVDTSGQTGNQFLSTGVLTFGAHTLDIQPVSGAAVTFFGVDAQANTINGIRVSNVARTGMSAANYAGLTAASFEANLTQMASGFTYVNVNVMLGVNDMVQSRTPTQFAADLATITSEIATALPNASITIVTQTDSGYTGQAFPFSAYVPSMRALANTNSYTFIDLFTALGAYNSNALALYLGGGNNHPTQLGGATMSGIITQAQPPLMENLVLQQNLSTLGGINPVSSNSSNIFGGLFIKDVSSKGISNINIVSGANQSTQPLLEIATTNGGTVKLDAQFSATNQYWLGTGGNFFTGTVGNNPFLIQTNSVETTAFPTTGGITLGSAGCFGVSSATNPGTGTSDTNLCRSAAATATLGNGTAGSVVGTLNLAAVQPTGPINFVATATPGTLTAGAPTAGGSCTAGSHTFKVTFLNAIGETLPSSVSATQTCGANATVPLTAIPVGPPGTTGRNIYANQAAGATWFLVAASPVLANNTTTTYSFTTADGSLTVAAPGSNTTAGAVFQSAGTTVGTISAAGNSKVVSSQTTGYVFGSLPSCVAASLGMLLYCQDCKNVTDDTTGIFDSAAASGGHGTNVLCEGSVALAWRVH